jgi:hypothetical protein
MGRQLCAVLGRRLEQDVRARRVFQGGGAEVQVDLQHAAVSQAPMRTYGASASTRAPNATLPGKCGTICR